MTMNMDVIRLIKNNMKMGRNIDKKINRSKSHEEIAKLNIEKKKFNEEIKKIIKGYKTADNFYTLQGLNEGLDEDGTASDTPFKEAQGVSLERVKLWSTGLKEQQSHEYDPPITITEQMESLREFLTQLETQAQNSQIKDNIVRVSAEIMQQWQEIEKIEQSVGSQARVTELELAGRESEVQLQESREEVSKLTQAMEELQADKSQVETQFQAFREQVSQLTQAETQLEARAIELKEVKDSESKLASNICSNASITDNKGEIERVVVGNLFTCINDGADGSPDQGNNFEIDVSQVKVAGDSSCIIL